MKNYLLLIALTISLISCNETTNIADDLTANHLSEPLTHIKPTAEIKEGYWRGEKITYFRQDGMNLLGGDILIGDNELSDTAQTDGRTEGTGTSNTNLRWPNANMWYVFDNGNATQRKYVTDAMAAWTRATGFTFQDVSRFAVIRDHVRIRFGNVGNNSQVGYVRGTQILNLQSVGVGVAVHELGHAIGMHHEQIRSDRDSYININLSNIRPGWRSQFAKLSSAENVLANVSSTQAFDYSSIMLYPSYNNSAVVFNTSIPTMTRKNGTTWGDNIYNGTNAPSRTDAFWVKFYYNLPR
jgi:Astacin (Peptidase family M12A)